MRKYEAVCGSDVLDAVANGERIVLIDRLMESIDSVDEISTRDLAIAIKAENKDNRIKGKDLNLIIESIVELSLHLGIINEEDE